jgi:hypothetical protein
MPDRDLELLCLRDPFRRQVGGPEGLRDDDFRIGKLALEDRGRTLFVRSYDEVVARTLKELA